MPLADLNATKKVTMPDGDWYELRRDPGFYMRLLGKYATTPVAVAVDESKANDLLYGPYEAAWQLERFKIFIAAWSHKEELNEENIKRIPHAHAIVLLEETGGLLASLEAGESFLDQDQAEPEQAD